MSKPLAQINNITIEALDMAKAIDELQKAKLQYAISPPEIAEIGRA